MLRPIANGASIIVAGDLPATLREALTRQIPAIGARRIGFIRLSEVEGLPGADERDRFDGGVLIAPGRHRENCWPIAERFASLIRPGGRFLLVIGDVFDETAPVLTPDALPRQPMAMLSRLRLDEVSLVAASGMRLLVQSAMMASARASLGGSTLGGMARIAYAMILATFSAGLNLPGLYRRSASGALQCSSIFLVLHSVSADADDTGAKSSDAFVRPPPPAAGAAAEASVFRL